MRSRVRRGENCLKQSLRRKPKMKLFRQTPFHKIRENGEMMVESLLSVKIGTPRETKNSFVPANAVKNRVFHKKRNRDSGAPQGHL